MRGIPRRQGSLPRSLAVLGALALSLSVAGEAIPCAPALPRGEEVRIAGEEAAIFWDASTHTETFVRKAAFQSTAKSFGFLVPTPEKPALGELPSSVFDDLRIAIRPRTEQLTKGYSVSFTSVLGLFLVRRSRSASAEAAAPAAVRVLENAKVAGFDATVLEADDASALSAWLGKNGFDETPELTEWLAPYVAKKWKMTAFKLDGSLDGASAQALATSAVKMTFHTDTPFYPYREPKERSGETKLAASGQAPTSRLLRVYFVSDAKQEAHLGDAPWSAKTLFAAPIDRMPSEIGLVAKQRFVTTFVDESFPRRGTDEVTFTDATDQAEVKQPPVIVERPREIPIPVDLLLALGAGITVIVVVRRRRRPAVH